MFFFFKTYKTNASKQVKSDTSIKYERSKVMDEYKTIVSKADNKVVDHFQSINHQIQKTLNAGIFFNIFMSLIAIGLIAASLFIFITNPNNNRYQHYFSVLVFMGGIAVLALLFFRNPVSAFQQFVGNYIKLNIVFTNYIRQANLIDAAIRQAFIESPDELLENTESTLQLFQDLTETTVERANQLLDEW